MDKTPIFDRTTQTTSGEIAYPSLHIAHSPDATLNGMILPLHQTFVAGREHIADATMSRQHARFTRSGNTVEVEDLGSTNGTQLDGKPISGKTVVPPGAVVRVSQTLICVDLLDPKEALQPLAPFTGVSAPMRALYASLRRYGPTANSVLITGATGTGKELAARALHETSRRAGALVAVNCGAIATTLAESALFGHQRGAFTGADTDHKGYFEQADGGTLFLDEIAELAAPLQAKLLRALESGEIQPVGGKQRRVDVRVIAAANVDLHAERFRPDLLARISACVVRTPALDEHKGDIPALVERFTQRTADVLLLEALMLRRWPLNVRGLRNVCGQMLLEAGDSGDLTLAHLPPSTSGQPPAPVPSNTRGPSKEQLESMLIDTRGNVAEIARMLGKERRQIYRWLHAHDLDVEKFR